MIYEWESRLRKKISEWAVRHENAVWREGLSHLGRARRGMVPAPAQEAQIALELLDAGHRQWEGTPPADELIALMGQANHYTYMMEAALLAGQLERTRDLAKSVIKLEQEISQRWRRRHSSLAVHSANIALGHVALRAGDVEGARRYLLAAAEVRGVDPVLVTYGPDLELAQELLERGYADTVVDYLKSWRKRWRVGRELMDWWIQQISEGKAARVNKSKYLSTRRLRHFFPSLKEILAWTRGWSASRR